MTGVTDVERDTSSFMLATFVPFEALSVAEVPFFSGPAITSAILFNVPKNAELTAIAERFEKKDHLEQHWY